MFLCVCSTSLLKILWEKEKLPLFPQCFLPVWRTFCHFHQIWNCRLQTLSVWKSLKFVVWERVKAIYLLEIHVVKDKWTVRHKWGGGTNNGAELDEKWPKTAWNTNRNLLCVSNIQAENKLLGTKWQEWTKFEKKKIKYVRKGQTRTKWQGYEIT